MTLARGTFNIITLLLVMVKPGREAEGENALFLGLKERVSLLTGPDGLFLMGCTPHGAFRSNITRPNFNLEETGS